MTFSQREGHRRTPNCGGPTAGQTPAGCFPYVISLILPTTLQSRHSNCPPSRLLHLSSEKAVTCPRPQGHSTADQFSNPCQGDPKARQRAPGGPSLKREKAAIAGPWPQSFPAVSSILEPRWKEGWRGGRVRVDQGQTSGPGRKA